MWSDIQVYIIDENLIMKYFWGKYLEIHSIS